LLLEKGLIAATGTHKELMLDNPLYMEIVQSQLREDKPSQPPQTKPQVEQPEGQVL